MKCAICNGDMIKKVGVINFNSRSIGKVVVPGIPHQICNECGEILIDVTQSENVIAYVKRKERETIEQLPIGNFLSSNEAAKILGVTKQAFSKNQKIKNGFIYSVEIDGRKLYDRESVVLFKRTGNGKYLLKSTGYEYASGTIWKAKKSPRYTFHECTLNVGRKKTESILIPSKPKRVIYSEDSRFTSKIKSPFFLIQDCLQKGHKNAR